MKRILLSVIAASLSLFAEFRAIDADTLVKMRDAGVPVIDIRTPAEWQQTGIIKGAHKMMFFDERGQVNAPEWMYRLGTIVNDKSKPFIIYCAHANRTKLVGEWLSNQMGFQKVYELRGGIENGWLKYKKPTVRP